MCRSEAEGGVWSASEDRWSARLNSSSSGNFADLLFFNDTATTEIYTLSLHDALPILSFPLLFAFALPCLKLLFPNIHVAQCFDALSPEHTSRGTYTEARSK